MTRNVWEWMEVREGSHAMSEEWAKLGHAWLTKSAWHSMFGNGWDVSLWSITHFKNFSAKCAIISRIQKQLRAVCYDKLVNKMKEVMPSAKKINVTRKINTLRGQFRRWELNFIIHTYTHTYTYIHTFKHTYTQHTLMRVHVLCFMYVQVFTWPVNVFNSIP